MNSNASFDVIGTHGLDMISDYVTDYYQARLYSCSIPDHVSLDWISHRNCSIIASACPQFHRDSRLDHKRSSYEAAFVNKVRHLVFSEGLEGQVLITFSREGSSFSVFLLQD